MNYLFSKIKIINPVQNLNNTADLWIKDGVIHQISTNQIIPDPDTEIIDGSGLIASPGFFDMHVHFRDPGFEQKEDTRSGAESAANGGFTGVVIMPNTNPQIHDKSVVDYIKSKSENLLVDIFISGCITKKEEGKELAPMEELKESGVIMFTDDGKCVTNSEIMRKAFDSASKSDLLISQHCEDTDLTGNFDMNESEISKKLGLKGYPSVAEESILYRDILLAEYCGNRRYHAQHISTKNAVEIIRHAKKKGLRVTSEVTPHHFTLADHAICCDCDTNLKMNPPLRRDEDILALKQGLRDGTIDAIATDHAPHTTDEKSVEFNKAPNGILGLETALGLSVTHLVKENYLSLPELIEKLAINPRSILKLDPIIIAEGNMANLTIFDPNEEWIVDISKFKSKSKNSPFDKMKLTGKVKFTINNNKIHISDL